MLCLFVKKSITVFDKISIKPTNELEICKIYCSFHSVRIISIRIIRRVSVVLHLYLTIQQENILIIMILYYALNIHNVGIFQKKHLVALVLIHFTKSLKVTSNKHF